MKKTLFYLIASILFTTFYNCDNDNGNAPNETQCNYEGLTYSLDSNNSTQTVIPEVDLTTELFPNNGGTGIAAVEIYGGTPFVVFTTNAVTLGATENINILIDGTPYPATVTCQRAGIAVGDEFRYDITSNSLEAEYCVIIDTVTP